MNKTTFWFVALICGWLGMIVPALAADSLLLAAGAGYKKPVESLCAQFSQDTGIEMRRFYGNIAQILAQSERDGRVDVLIGDGKFLDKSRLELSRRVYLGTGRAVLAWTRGVKLERLADVTNLARVAMPDPKQAIYGRAAAEYIEYAGLRFAKAPMVVATVPQISTYLVTGEIDAGFINLTETLALRDKIGGYIELPTDSYTAIRIQAVLPVQAEPHPVRERFADYLTSEHARTILREFGL